MASSIADFDAVEIASWRGLRKYARPNWLFRGQSKAKRGLKTSFERCCKRNGIPRARWALVEDELFREFRRAYHQYSPTAPHRRAIVEWLSLMQHHGAPTRLLDFTYSIYVAAYFAVERGDDDAAVWAVNGKWAMEQSARLLYAAGKNEAKIDALVRRFSEQSEAMIARELFFSDRPASLACPLNPFRLNDRLRTQKGVFLAAGDVRKPFMANLRALPGHTSPRNIRLIVIPKRIRQEVIAELHRMNITRRTLFPGLDGYAQALGVYHPCFEPGAMLFDSVKYSSRHGAA